jgi:hypothetical protein
MNRCVIPFVCGILFASSICLEASTITRDVAVDPITTRWTFGAHEPFTMYRRIGRRSTGGIYGGSKWVKDWLDWWDEHAPARMEEIGLNALHSRFYKGMGWEVEKKDFPNVKKFVDNCHKHGVTVLAYVQFATLYHEVMQKEIPDIESWAAIDERGMKMIYSRQAARWLPCIVNEKWVEYTEKILTIAMTEGGFDGVMFDNAFFFGCHCPRCQEAFRRHIHSLPDLEERFGFAEMPGLRIPQAFRPENGDEYDPVAQEYYRWRVQCVNAVMKRFYRHIKSLKPDAIVSANSGSFRSTDNYHARSVDVIDMADGGLDLLMMQTLNFPAYLDDPKFPGQHYIVNRQRDLRMARDLGKQIVALSDGAAGSDALDESMYLRPLVEDLVWGGIPTDRTVMSPVRREGFIDEERFAMRKKVLAEFDAFVKANRAAFTGKPYLPVRVFYPSAACGLAVSMNLAVSTVDEILLRHHMPYGYVIVKGAEAPSIPADCEVLVLPNSKWMSDAQVSAVVDWAKKGGRLVVTGRDTGLRDENGAERFTNPLDCVRKLPNVDWRNDIDVAQKNALGWITRVLPPKDGGRAFMAGLGRVGYRNRFVFENLPEEVFVDMREVSDGVVIHLVNYHPEVQIKGARLVVPSGAKATAEEPFGTRRQAVPLGKDGMLPAFGQYLMVRIY